METQEVIHSKPVLSTKERIKERKYVFGCLSTFLLIVFAFNIIVSGSFYLFWLFGLMIIIALGIEFLDWSYAWTLTNAGIHLIKYNTIRTKVEFIALDQITEVKWNGGGRQLWFMVYLKSNKKHLILPKESIYTSAGLLRGFHTIGVKVSTTYRDAEVESFIQGDIDSIPINMDEM